MLAQIRDRENWFLFWYTSLKIGSVVENLGWMVTLIQPAKRAVSTKVLLCCGGRKAKRGPDKLGTPGKQLLKLALPPKAVSKWNAPTASVCVHCPVLGALVPAHGRHSRVGSGCRRDHWGFGVGVSPWEKFEILDANSCFLAHFQPEN